MNKLSLEKRTQILGLLVEGNSLRSAARLSDTSLTTVIKLLVDVGRACIRFHDATVKNLNTTRIQCDETWSFVYSKQRNVPEHKRGSAGDAWVWVAMDSESKLVITWFVGNRDLASGTQFMKDLAWRLNNRVTLSTDGLKAYVYAVYTAFGDHINFGQTIKQYVGNDEEQTERRYSPSKLVKNERARRAGKPRRKNISTSLIERQNMTMRMSMRRFTRLTNAFSKKLENHACAVALHYAHYNFCRIHRSIRVTPAMEAGLTKDFLELEDIARLPEIFPEE